MSAVQLVKHMLLLGTPDIDDMRAMNSDYIKQAAKVRLTLCDSFCTESWTFASLCSSAAACSWPLVEGGVRESAWLRASKRY